MNATETAQRITEYLCAGGLFNPESMEHDKVRELLMDCRTQLTTELATSTRLMNERDQALMRLAGMGKKLDIAEAKLKFCAGLAEHWRMQASVTSRRSAWSANGALEKCAVELEKALALDQIGKEAHE